MRKVIKISNKEYSMKSSAYTQFKYKNDTGRKLLDDLRSLIKIRDEQDEDNQIKELDNFVEVILKISYVMIEEADDKQVTSFDDFLKNIDGMFDEKEWMNDVIELAISPFSRGIQTSSPNNQ